MRSIHSFSIYIEGTPCQSLAGNTKLVIAPVFEVLTLVVGRGRSVVMGVLPPGVPPPAAALRGPSADWGAALGEATQAAALHFLPVETFASIRFLTSHLRSFAEPPVSEVMEISLILTLSTDPRPLLWTPLGLF